MPVAESNARVTITLDKDQLKIIDIICDLTTSTRSEFISTCIDKLLISLDSESRERIDKVLHPDRKA